MDFSISSKSSGKSTLRFVLLSTSYKFRLRVNPDIMTTVDDLKELVKGQLEKKLKTKIKI